MQDMGYSNPFAGTQNMGWGELIAVWTAQSIGPHGLVSPEEAWKMQWVPSKYSCGEASLKQLPREELPISI